MQRESFGTRLGFILISAGCAVGLGNVWRFPYVVGQFGGGAFILIYLVFLVAIGIPLIAMEYATGRASRASVAKSFEILTPGNKLFNWFSIPAALGSYILMAFYTTICGWILYYLIIMAQGGFLEKTAGGAYVMMEAGKIGPMFGALLGNPLEMTLWMVVVVVGCFLVVGIGLQKGVETVTKFMMISLFAMLIILAVRCMLLPGAMKGLEFYIVPDWNKVVEKGVWNTIYAALAQAVFTLSIGIGSMAIFGSYAGKEKRLTGESITVTVLDTVSAYIAGLIIFPACFAFGIEADAGPGLVFITLPNVFNQMGISGILWGTLFFIFLLFAGIATVIAVFENIIAICQDWFGWSRAKSAVINCVIVIVISIPCVLGFNLWSGFAPLGKGTNMLDLEDFVLSNNILPIGCLVYLLYCCSKHGWGWKNFITEVNTGDGMKFPEWGLWRFYLTWIAPAILILIFVMGYLEKFKLI